VSAPTPLPATPRSQYHCPYSLLVPITPFPQERCSQCTQSVNAHVCYRTHGQGSARDTLRVINRCPYLPFP
jgi:hypothetical protein